MPVVLLLLFADDAEYVDERLLPLFLVAVLLALVLLTPVSPPPPHFQVCPFNNHLAG